MNQQSSDAIPDAVADIINETLGEGWTLTRSRDGWTEAAFVAEREGRRLFIKTSVLVPAMRRLAELEIIPPLVAWGELAGASFIIQDFVDVPYPEHTWFAEHLNELAHLIRTYQLDEPLAALLAAQKLTYGADDFEWVEKGYRAVIETYGEHAPIRTAYARLLEQLPAMGGVTVVPTQGDLNRKNLLPTDERIYLVDWEIAALSDPMRDIGPLLWWYVPPARWPEFFGAYGSPLGEGHIERIYWWAARTSLEIAQGLLERGYWTHATDFLIDFLASVNREENPHARYGRSIIGSP